MVKSLGKKTKDSPMEWTAYYKRYIGPGQAHLTDNDAIRKP